MLHADCGDFSGDDGEPLAAPRCWPDTSSHRLLFRNNAVDGTTFDRSSMRTRGDRTIDYTVDGARDNGDVTRSRTRVMDKGDDLRSVTVSKSRLPDGDRSLTRTRTTVDGDDATSRTVTRTMDPGQKPTVSRSTSSYTLPQ